MMDSRSQRCRGFRGLYVFKKARELASETINLTDRYPKSEIFSSVPQMRRAAFSIISNIAEGYRRGSRKEYINFLRIAYGSCGELSAQLIVSSDVHWISPEDYQRMQALTDNVSGLLWKLINSLTRA